MKPAKNKPGTAEKTSLFKCFFERDLLAYKGFSFFLYGAFGSFYPYLLLYFKQYGLTSFQAGTIVGIRPLIQLFGAPFCTTLGERFKAEKIVLVFGVLAWLIKALIILSITPQNQLCVEKYTNSTNITSLYTTDLWRQKRSENPEWTVTVSSSESEPEVVPMNKLVQVEHDQKPAKRSKKIFYLNQRGPRKNLFGKAVLNQQKDLILSITSQSKKLQPQIFFDTESLSDSSMSKVGTVEHFDKGLNETISFTIQVDHQEIEYIVWVFLMIIIIGEFLESPTYALSDASLLGRLDEDRGYYGQIRLWGAIGWAISTALVGYLIYKTSYTLCGLLKPDYDIIFYVYFGFVSCALICCYWFSFKDKEGQHKSTFKKALKELSSANHLVFIMAILFAGSCYGFLFHFVNWYIDDRGGSSLVMGAAGAARELGEMTFFLLGGVCVRFLGNLNMMAICLVSYAACFYWYSVIDSPWLAVPLEALDGSIYGLVWSNSVDYMSTLGAPIGAVVTMQGILQGIFYGLGNGGGTVLSGYLYESIGAQKTFQYFAVAALVVLLFLLIVYPIADGCIARKQKRNKGIAKYEPIPTEDEPVMSSKNDKPAEHIDESKLIDA